MLQKHAENLWSVEHELGLPLGIPFPTRMIVIRLPDASLALISAVPIDDALAAELAAVGPVSHLIAPNRLHHLHLPAAAARYPEARVLAAPGVGEKHPGLALEPLEPDAVPALRDVLGARAIEGASKIAESLLLHRPSRTLIATDFVFNVERAPSWRTALLLSLTGTRGRLAQSRVWRFLPEDRARVAASSERLFDWDFERLIVAHGEPVLHDAKARLAAVVLRPQRMLDMKRTSAS